MTSKTVICAVRGGPVDVGSAINGAVAGWVPGGGYTGGYWEGGYTGWGTTQPRGYIGIARAQPLLPAVSLGPARPPNAGSRRPPGPACWDPAVGWTGLAYALLGPI